MPLPYKAIFIVEAPLRSSSPPWRAEPRRDLHRMLRVHRLLRDFHERELAQAVYAAILWDAIAKSESLADTPWVVEGVSAALADRWLARAPAAPTAYD